VAASGFLASSYSLFATNVVAQAWLFVYPCGGWGDDISLGMDSITLFGSIVGMILIGHLSDLKGRRRVYGWELAILIFSTIGLVQAGAGYMYDSGVSHSMDIYSWIAGYRFLLGFAIGADESLYFIQALVGFLDFT